MGIHIHGRRDYGISASRLRMKIGDTIDIGLCFWTIQDGDGTKRPFPYGDEYLYSSTYEEHRAYTEVESKTGEKIVISHDKMIGEEVKVPVRVKSFEFLEDYLEYLGWKTDYSAVKSGLPWAVRIFEPLDSLEGVMRKVESLYPLRSLPVDFARSVAGYFRVGRMRSCFPCELYKTDREIITFTGQVGDYFKDVELLWRPG